MRNYTPRRASSRWLDGDCPKGVLAIFDHPATTDRYTVFYAEPVVGESYADMWLGYRGMSAAPFHPQGVGIYGEMRAHQVAEYRYRNAHRACKWSDLPEQVKQCVRQDCRDDSAAT
jgi:hypothetical protein